MTWMADVRDLLEMFSPVLLNVVAWWRFRYRQQDSLSNWRRRVTRLGLFLNSAAIVMCWAMIIVPVSLDFAIIATLVLSALSVICGVFCLGTARLLVIATGILTGAFWFWMTPHIGVL